MKFRGKQTGGDTELLSLHTIQARNAWNQKKGKTEYSAVHYPSKKHTTNTVSQVEAEIQLVS